jgi:hypothetical protein
MRSTEGDSIGQAWFHTSVEMHQPWLILWFISGKFLSCIQSPTSTAPADTQSAGHQQHRSPRAGAKVQAHCKPFPVGNSCLHTWSRIAGIAVTRSFADACVGKEYSGMRSASRK